MRKLRTTFALGMALCTAIALALPVAAGAATPGAITGKVTNAATGSPVASVYVCAYTATTDIYEGCAYTGPTGEYKIENLPAGSYKVEFDGSTSYEGEYFTQWYSGKSEFATADPVLVTEGNTTTGINAALVERGGKISGTVTDAGNGAPIGNIEVCAANAAYSSIYFYESCQRTNSGGQYTLTYLEAGSYRVEFSSPYKYNESTGESELEGPNYVTQFYTGKAHAEEGDLISVSDGSTTSGIDAALQAGATISGTVTDAITGAPLRGVDACAWGASNFYCDSTNASGQYSITTVPTGSYKVEFDPEQLYIGYTPGQPEKEHWQRSEYALAVRSATVEVARHFSYNARGDRTSDELPNGETRIMQYNLADELTQIGPSTSYSYNGDGLRVSKSVNGFSTSFVWDEGETPPELLEAGETSYLYGPDGGDSGGRTSYGLACGSTNGSSYGATGMLQPAVGANWLQ